MKKPVNSLVAGWTTKKPETPRFEKEKSRRAVKRRERDGKAHGFGSWFMRVPGDYSTSEFFAKQSNPDRVCTADLRSADKYQRAKEQDLSDKESD